MMRRSAHNIDTMNLGNKIKDIFGTAFNEVKRFVTRQTAKETEQIEAFQKLTRNEKRSYVICADGENMKAFKYIDTLVKRLPEIKRKTSKAVIDHRTELRAVFMEYGLVGINKYIDKINYFIKHAA